MIGKVYEIVIAIAMHSGYAECAVGLIIYTQCNQIQIGLNRCLPSIHNQRRAKRHSISVSLPAFARSLLRRTGGSISSVYMTYPNTTNSSFFMVWRNISIRYKQTALGASWAIIQPVTQMVVFSLVFGRLAQMPVDGDVPYPLFNYAGLLPVAILRGIGLDSQPTAW
jgi:hypothetical protein